MGAREGIKHVVVLMLENRSFDCILGKLYPRDPSFEGVDDTFVNRWLNAPINVWSSEDELTDDSAVIPDPDPGELFKEMTEQLYGGPIVPGPPPMTGFVADYMNRDPKPPLSSAVMHVFTPNQLPVISTLGKAFGVVDQWHASAPCQTWPNRFFAHCGTSLGYVDNGNFPTPFPAPSIFARLSRCGHDWRVYFHDVPQALLLKDILAEAPLRFRYFSTFLSDAANGTLPHYSFIEPQYFTDVFSNLIPNDEHPPHNVLYGEQLIAAVYNAVRSSPLWRKVLLVITYDEHGGCYDHVPPPVAVPPDGHKQNGCTFTRYGVRVPALLVSPYIAPGSKVRVAPMGLPDNGPPYPFDHTSIIRTLRELFDLGGALTARDAAAPDLLGPLSLDTPQNDGPAKIQCLPPPPKAEQLLREAESSLNQMQEALTRFAWHLVPSALWPVGAPPPSPPQMTVAKAQAVSALQVKTFLGL